MFQPIFISPVAAGFPSPAAEYIEKYLDLNEHLVKHPEATFFVRVDGCSMIGAGINSGDILIVDKAQTPQDGSIVVSFINGEFTVKRLCRKNNQTYLIPENNKYKPIKIEPTDNFEIWGTVTYVIHKTNE